MVRTELEAAAKVGEAHPGKHATFTHRTHKLEKSTKGQVIRTSKGGFRVRLSNARKYAAAIDLGAKPHTITARRAKNLRFIVGGKLMFRKTVQHPGNRPYRFLYRATQAAARVAGANLESGMARAAKAFK